MAQKSSAMAFYHQDGLVPAWQQASEYAGQGGRIATLPDIISARLATKPDITPWNTYFTTLSAEYMGHSRGGRRILIVAHGVGPMATIEGILKAYSYEFNDKSRRRNGGRISLAEFRDLESGKYGPVEIVDLETLASRYKYPFIEELNEEQALQEPLLKARLGPRAEEYIKHHGAIARQWHEEQSNIIPENRGHSSRQEYIKYLLTRKGYHRSFSQRNPYIIEMKDASNCPYGYRLTPDTYFSYLGDGQSALAHLLKISQLYNSLHEDYESLVCDISCHEWWNGVRLVAVPHASLVTDIHSGQ